MAVTNNGPQLELLTEVCQLVLKSLFHDVEFQVNLSYSCILAEYMVDIVSRREERWHSTTFVLTHDVDLSEFKSGNWRFPDSVIAELTLIYG